MQKLKPTYIRDTLIFIMGMVGVVQQTFFAPHVQSALLILFAGMLGLPSMLHIDEIRFGKDSNNAGKS